MTTAEAFKIQALTDRSRQIYAQHHHVLIGISPANSYFSRERITRITQWAAKEFYELHLVTLEEPFSWSLRAVGYPDGIAQRKANKEFRLMRGRAFAALGDARIADPESHFLTWRDLMANASYRQTRDSLYELFHNDDIFRTSLLDCVRNYLSHQELFGELSLADRCSLGVHYLLDELPLFIHSPEILQVQSSLYYYHILTELDELLYLQPYNALSVSPHQGRLLDETL